ncbi:MAG: methylenetetrahydrofolate--tRNA-(uracil(54)-C(5))-methyltransferase (FADH(2)-oxidizing) TrmFO [Syntrophobacterales bacterium]|nr:MAG: methylenetetrahydrofolate--tRNA-(uracil(54)-C(5))-methyltransferase (FADH(2)-oxidizing) TrmFO [Syntrophobacterales bacterium]
MAGLFKKGHLIIIGAGLAGCEAAWQASSRGTKVVLFEMKPIRFSPAHRSENLGELVCSNSLKSASLENAVGLLKEEMRRFDSLIMEAADHTKVPAGGSLAVDRDAFSDYITRALEKMEGVELIRLEADQIPLHLPTIIATGPLTSDRLAKEIMVLTGTRSLYFYDAISPIVARESINMEVTFRASRYGKGGDDYINCPMTKEHYYRFVDELLKAERIPRRDFERAAPFEGCLPIEAMAERGVDTLAFGPLKPVGLIDPKTGQQPFATVQLRQDNLSDTLYSMVGFQTKLRWREQERIFRMIPGLERAKFVRFGSQHRNTFINAPKILRNTLQARRWPNIFFAGQLTGVEGYVESAAMGLLAGLNGHRLMGGMDLVIPPPTTALGSLVTYITRPAFKDFQPMNVNFGLFPPLNTKLKGRFKRRRFAERALRDLQAWKREIG